MATIFSFKGDSLANGALTTSSAGTGDNTWTTVTSGWTIATAAVRSPAIQCDQVAATAGMVTRNFTSTTTSRGRFYWKFTGSATASNHTILRMGAGSARGFDLSWVATGRLRLLDSANTTVTDTPVSSITAGTSYRISWTATPTTVTVNIYAGDSATVLYSLNTPTPAANKYGSTFDRLTLGNTATTPTAPTMQFDDVLLDDATEPGSAGSVPNAGPDQSGIEPYSTVTLDGSASSAGTYAWTQTSGTTVTLSSTSAAQPTFTAPGTLAGTTLVFSLNDAGGTGTPDTVSIAVLPVTERAVIGGVEVPMRLVAL